MGGEPSSDSVSVAVDGADELGEGALWDQTADQLLRVDIIRGRVHGWEPATGTSWSSSYEGEVSAVSPRTSRSGLVLAIGHEIVLDDGEPEVLASVETDRPDNRFNDCRCDPQGRFWAGTMSKTRTPGEAALYRLAPGGEIELVLANTTLSNGLGWSPAGDQMYFIDSTTQRVDVFDFDGATGDISERRPWAHVDPTDGLPDGLAVDAEGGVWVCLFGGGAVRRYGEQGALDDVVELPVTNPTCPAFGGPGLRTLYVTSARHRLSATQLANEAHAGAVLALPAPVAGLPANRFGG